MAECSWVATRRIFGDSVTVRRDDVNFSDPTQELDRAIFLRADRRERVHVYERTNGTFGCRNFVWVEESRHRGIVTGGCWTVGNDWGHRYDSLAIAIREAGGRYPWLGEILTRGG